MQERISIDLTKSEALECLRLHMLAAQAAIERNTLIKAMYAKYELVEDEYNLNLMNGTFVKKESK